MKMVASARIADLMAGLRLHETKLRFLVAGGLNTLFGLAIFPLLMWSLSDLAWHYLVVLSISQALSIVFSYLTNKFLVFRTRRNYFREFGKFISFHLLIFAVNLLALPILVEVGNVPPVWGQLFFALMVIVSSYFWHSKITFRTGSHNR